MNLSDVAEVEGGPYQADSGALFISGILPVFPGQSGGAHI